MSKHTPGPWDVESDGTSVAMANQVCVVAPSPDWADNDTTKANARLIAAAPELLEALSIVSRWLPAGDIARPDQIAIRDTVRAAIAKATER